MTRFDFIVCYPWLQNGKWGEELKYSIRSLEKYLEGRYRIWMFINLGHPIPHWIKGVEVHNENWQREKAKGCKQINKARQLYVANRTRLPFVWMNDDIYLLKPSTLLDLKQNYVTSLNEIDKWDKNRRRSWYFTLELTDRLLKRKGIQTSYCADTHCPYVYEPSLYRNMIDVAGYAQQFASQTFYYNLYLDGTPPMVDHEVKAGFYGPAKPFEIRDSHRYFNHNDAALVPEMIDFLKARFPDQSRFEK